MFPEANLRSCGNETIPSLHKKGKMTSHPYLERIFYVSNMLCKNRNQQTKPKAVEQIRKLRQHCQLLLLLLIKRECQDIKRSCLQLFFKISLLFSPIFCTHTPSHFSIFGRKKFWYVILFYSAFCSATHARNHYIPNLIWVLLHTH